MKNLSRLHYKPALGLFGDPMPFFWNGIHHIFFQNSPGEFSFDHMQWSHISSTDLISWQSHTPALQPEAGGVDACGCWTGSIIRAGELFHAFYTGCAEPDGGGQTICHAVSENLLEWEKDSRNPILLPQAPFSTAEKAAWRDPAIVQRSDGSYHMVLSAELPDEPDILKGCLAEFRSLDLVNWQFHSIFHAPLEAQKMECPDIFRLDDVWALLYSSDFGVQIRSRMAENEQWKKMVPGQLDDFRFYAAKTLLDEKQRRISFGFISDRVEDSDTSPWNWGGVLSLPRLIRQDETGGFQILPVDEMQAFKQMSLPLSVTEGSFSGEKKQLTGDSVAYSVANEKTALLGFGQHPDLWQLEFSLLCNEGDRTNLLFCCEKELKSGYRLEFDAHYHCISLARLNPQQIGDSLTLQSINIPDALWHEPKITIFFDQTVIEVFVGYKMTFSCRVYELLPECNWWGFLSNDGHIHLKDIAAWKLKSPADIK